MIRYAESFCIKEGVSRDLLTRNIVWRKANLNEDERLV